MSRPLYIYSAGFSTLELITVVSISLILCALSMPSVWGLTEQKALVYETKRLSSAINSLILSAKQREHDIKLTLTQNGYRAVTDTEIPINLGRFSLSENVAIHLPNGDPKNVYIRTTNANTPYTIKLKKGERLCTVTISLRGRVTPKC